MIAKKLPVIQGRWTKEEKLKFLKALESNTKCWAEISLIIGTRTQEQCRSHYQKLKISQRVHEINLKKSNKPKPSHPPLKFTTAETQSSCLSPVISPACFIPNEDLQPITPKTEASSEFELVPIKTSEKSFLFFEFDDEEPEFLRF